MTFVLVGLEKYPKEGEIIGRLLAGYGELEFAMASCLNAVIDDIDVVVKVLFRVRGEEGRIAIADALMRHEFEGTTLYQTYQHAISDMKHCKTIRNQFAHCMFDGRDGSGLRFVDLEATAKSTTVTTVRQIPIGVDVLSAQQEFFGFVQWRFFWLAREFELRAGKISSHTVEKPRSMPRPPLNSLPPKLTNRKRDQRKRAPA